MAMLKDRRRCDALRCTKIVLWECGHFRDAGSSMHAAVALLDAAGFDTLLLSNRLPLLISRGYWHSAYNVSGWRNCASFSRTNVDIESYYSILSNYSSHAAPIATQIFPRGYQDDPPHHLFNPLADDCPGLDETITVKTATRGRGSRRSGGG